MVNQPIFQKMTKREENTIANLLAEWGLIKLVNPEQTSALIVPLNQLKILSYKEKDEWTLITKYNIGNKKVNYEYDNEEGNG